MPTVVESVRPSPPRGTSHDVETRESHVLNSAPLGRDPKTLDSGCRSVLENAERGGGNAWLRGNLHIKTQTLQLGVITAELVERVPFAIGYVVRAYPF